MAESGISPELNKLIVMTAGQFGLPPEILRAMVVQESGGNPWAIRYEPGFFRRYLDGKPMNFVPKGCSADTERNGRAISWGLLQIMGETARAQGFRGGFPELCDPDVGLYWAALYLSRLRDRYFDRGGWDGVVRAYNGGPGNWDNPLNHYPDAVRSRIPGGAWPTTEASHG